MSKDRILVIKLSALGDFILSLGAMQAIRKHHPNAHITLMTTPPFKEIAERSNYFDEVFAFERAKFYKFGAWMKIFSFLNGGAFTRVYDLQCQDRTKIYHSLFMRKPEWVGVIKGTKFFYDNPQRKTIHAFKRHQEMLKLAGINHTPIPDISWMKSDISHLLEMNNIKKPYVIFVPGCSPTHPEKRWPAIRYGGLALKLIHDGYDVVMIGSHADEEQADLVRKACPEVKSLVGMTSLYDIYSLAEQSCGIVGNDTGPCHIASLSNKPMVSLFCSKVTTPALSAPVGAHVTGIEANNMANIPVNHVYKAFKPNKE